ncbi:MAG TPA: hypothetical protein VF240_14090 [Pyrinomonadaceae bacterium]
MRAKSIYSGVALLVSVLSCPNFAAAQGAPIDASVARQYFGEARTACEQDGGKLWGRSLCGPMLFVDPLTRAVVANQKDAEGLLTAKDDVFVGRLSDRQPVANAYITWAGVRWTMIMWPFMTKDPLQRVKLMMHESFHRIQNDLKFPAVGGANDHLDTRDGRVWLQLEWRALRQALTSGGAARRRAVEDALTFRKYRRSLFPKAEAAERELEMNEGLAEYTGFKLSAAAEPQLIAYLTRQIEQAPGRPTFVGSFAYSSGPAYGILLDASLPDWRKGLTPQDDLGELLRRAHRIKLPSDLKARAEKQAAQYDAAALRLTESAREATRRKLIAEYRMRLVDGPTLLAPKTATGRVAFNSTNIVPLEGVGTVYPTATVRDEWGVLEVSNGALMVSEGGRITKVYVPAPADLDARPLKGDGWTLELNSGWVVIPGERKGDYILKRPE